MAFCFHTYVRTPDVSSVRISGLKGVDFIDKTVEGHPVKTEAREDIAVGEFTDRVYKSAPSHVGVSDSEKTLVFEKTSGKRYPLVNASLLLQQNVPYPYGLLA